MADKVTDGYKHDGDKPRLDLVPPEIIEAVGRVMSHGISKYGEGNYRKVEPKRYRAALMRHICKWLKNPYGIDEDSGLPHLYHIACNVAFLLELDKEQKKEDSMMIIAPNPDKDAYQEMTKAVEKNEGYCPCAIEKSEDMKCPCKAFREQETAGECHCGRFIKDYEYI